MARELSATNTLILVVSQSSCTSALLSALHPHFAAAARLLLWAPLQGLGRAIAVFDSASSAAHAKATFDRTIVEQTDVHESVLLRVYDGPNTPQEMLAKSTAPRLEVPPLDKNFLISPPGSPPVGWEQIREEGPNMATLADDLIQALSGLGLATGEYDRGEGSSSDGDHDIRRAGTPLPPRGHHRIDSDTTLVQPADDDSTPEVRLLVPEDPAPQPASSTTLLNTPHGLPRTIGGVRATADSFRGTARPPIDTSYDM